MNMSSLQLAPARGGALASVVPTCKVFFVVEHAIVHRCVDFAFAAGQA
jgi:hypothetical protein